MGRQLISYVHVGGVIYGPGSDVPDEVAAQITAPGVWAADLALPVTPPPPARPAEGATKAAWVKYAVAIGWDKAVADKLDRDDLAEATKGPVPPPADPAA